MYCRVEQIGNLDIKKVQKIIGFSHVEMAKYCKYELDIKKYQHDKNIRSIKIEKKSFKYYIKKNQCVKLRRLRTKQLN